MQIKKPQHDAGAFGWLSGIKPPNELEVFFSQMLALRSFVTFATKPSPRGQALPCKY